MNDDQERRIIKQNDNTDLGWRDHHRLILEGGPNQREDVWWLWQNQEDLASWLRSAQRQRWSPVNHS
jgi:hypothetical protein